MGVALHLGLSTVGWSHSLLEAHEFRQTQTALSARAMVAGDWRIDYPLPLFGPPWSAPFEFPIYQGLVAALAGFSGWPLEQCGRAVALLFFYLTLPALYLVQENLPIPRARWGWLPALVALSPVYLFYSRTFMIESCALCAGAWFLLAYGRALTRATPGWIATAAILGAVAGLVKATTFAVFLAGAAGLTVQACLKARREVSPGGLRRVALGALAVLLPVLIVTVAWTRYADVVKESNPLSAALSSDRLHEFLLGGWQRRTDPAAWAALGRNLQVAVLGGANTVLALVLGLLLWPGRRRVFLALASCSAAAPLLLFNLHAVHDYYFYASGVFALAALAVGWSNLLDAPGVSRVAGYATIGLSLVLQLTAYHSTYGRLQREPSRPGPEIARLLEATTQPDEIVLIVGQDWNPVIPYHAHRRAIMVTDESARHPERLDQVLDALRADERVTALLLVGEHRRQAEWIRQMTRRLKLGALPVAMSTDAALYLPDTATTTTRLPELQLREFTLVADTAENLNIPRLRLAGERLNHPRLHEVVPAHLREVVHPYDLAVHVLEDHPVLDAHAPTDVVLDLPEGPRELVIEFGILPGAWQANPPTDGMEFRVEVLRPAGASPVVLWRRFLDPVALPENRGRQRATIPIPAGAAGELRLRTLPGPTNSISCDWGYWRRIELP